MARRLLIATATICVGLLLSAPGAAQQRTADGVALNAEGLPQ